MQNIENKTEEHLNPTKFQDAPGTGVMASLIFMGTMLFILVLLSRFIH